MMKRLVSPLALILALPVFLAACGGFNGARDAQYTTARDHPIAVDPQIVAHEVAVAPDKIALSTDDKQALRALAGAFKQRGHGTLNISAPSGGPNTGNAVTVAAEIEELLHEAGIARARISHGGYRASAANTAAPVILSFRRYVATPSPCGNWSENYATSPGNKRTPNLGCSTQNNLAAMVADPAELKGPRDTDPADAARRDTVLDKYRKGESTASERTDDESGAVSKVAK